LINGSIRKVAALAGRRIDGPDVEPKRFPASSINSVRRQLEKIFEQEKIELLVCAAASGADLLALELALKLNIGFRIVLPFVPSRFRSTSVIDSSLEWGGIFDLVIAKAESTGDLVILDKNLTAEDAYKHATRAILAEANAAAAPEKALAIIVWEGKSRGPDDFTLQFRDLAIEAGMRERVVLTRSET
jgi:hypothetical protein